MELRVMLEQDRMLVKPQQAGDDTLATPPSDDQPPTGTEWPIRECVLHNHRFYCLLLLP